MPIIEKWEDLMLFKRTFLVVLVVLITGASGLWAGDSASFVDLGFSPDGSIYMFAQYGVKSGTLRPWADMYVVDVVRNNFVSGGRISYIHNKAIEAGQDGAGAMYRLITENAGFIEHYGLSYPNQGQPLYIALNGDPAYEGKPVVFRDFVSGVSYQADLVEKISGNGRNTKSSFYINLESIDGDGEAKQYTIGTPQLERNLISSYRIKRVMVAPSGNSLVFVVEMKLHGENGPDVRYMVEVLRL
jgi:predicted secreted protein